MTGFRCLCLVAVLVATPAIADGLPPPLGLPGVPMTPISGVATVTGVPMSLAYFTTDLAPRAVLSALRDGWARRGWPVVIDAPSDQEGIVSAFQTIAGLQYAVIARRHGGQTLCFAAVHSLWANPASRPGRSDVAPHAAPRLFEVQGSAAEIARTLDRTAAREGLTRIRTELSPGATVYEHAGRRRRVITAVVPAGDSHWVWQLHDGEGEGRP